VRIRSVAGLMLVAFCGVVAAYGAPAKRPGIGVRSTHGPVFAQKPAGPKWLWEVVESWEKLPGFEYFNGIDCSHEAGIAVTSQGRIFTSRDGGKHWTLPVTGLPAPENEDHPEFECCLASGDSLLAGAMKMIAISRDRGRSWTCASVTGADDWLRREWSVYAIKADPINPNHMIAAADIRAHVARGVWGYREEIRGGELVRVPIFRNITHRPATVLVMKSTDGGRHWTAQASPGGLALGSARGLHYQRRGRSILIGEHQDRFRPYYEERRPFKDVWVSTDDGATWSPAPNPDTFTAAWSTSSTVWIATGGAHMWTSSTLARTELWRSIDRGTTWREMRRPDRFNGDMALISQKIAVMSGDRDLYHTMNADGSTPRWVKDELPEGCDPMRVTVCPDGRYPFLAGAGIPSWRLAILGAVPPPNQQVKPMRMRTNGPTVRRRIPPPR